MKILILAKHLEHSLGGIEIQCDIIARQLLDMGHEVIYGTPTFKAVEIASHYPYTIVETNFTSRKTLESTFKAVRPDVIYLRNNKNNLFKIASTAKRHGIPLVFGASSLQDIQPWAYHYSNQPWTPRRILSVAWQRLKSRWNWIGYRYVDAAVSLNPDYLQSLPVKNRHYIPDSMDTTVVPFEWPRPYISWVAQLKDYKHPEEFVYLAEACNDLGVDFLMIGGLSHKHFSWITRHEGTPKNFHYLGPKTLHEVNGFLQSSLFMVHTCDPEGFGNNFIQAWLLKKPTFSLRFDPGGIICSKDLGTVPGSLEGLIRDTRKAIDSPETCKIRGMHAYEYAKENFDPRKNTKRLLSIFMSIKKVD